jgi:hypothetical protein
VGRDGKVGVAPRPELSMVEPAGLSHCPGSAQQDAQRDESRKPAEETGLSEDRADVLKMSNRLSGHGLWPIVL